MRASVAGNTTRAGYHLLADPIFVGGLECIRHRLARHCPFAVAHQIPAGWRRGARRRLDIKHDRSPKCTPRTKNRVNLQRWAQTNVNARVKRWKRTRKLQCEFEANSAYRELGLGIMTAKAAHKCDALHRDQSLPGLSRPEDVVCRTTSGLRGRTGDRGFGVGIKGLGDGQRVGLGA